MKMAGDGNTLDDRYAIHVAKAELREGYNQGDVERIVAIYSDTVTDLSDGMPSFSGISAKQVLRARLSSLFASHTVTLAPMTIEVILFDGTALAYGWHSMTMIPKSGGETSLRKVRYLELWRKTADGLWQIKLTIDNVDVPQEFPEQLIDAIRSGAIAPVKGLRP